MSDAPVSPKANRLASPSWLDTRLVLGVLLVLVSVVVGARVLSSASTTQAVLVAKRDLPAGATLTAEDLEVEEVRLDEEQTRRLLRAPDGENRYVGSVVRRPVDAGEFVPLTALRVAAETEDRQFTLNVEVGHFPPGLAPGDVVDVYVTPVTDGSMPQATPSPAGPTQLSATGSRQVLGGVVVESAKLPEGGLGGGSTSLPVVLNLARTDVLKMVTAVAQGRIDLVRVRGVRAKPGAAASPAAVEAAPSSSPAAG
ncbi:MAG: hypothetical protein JWO60_1248 [Frankiales bacterium]|nr:hypothetical protein [Frankiales bacterium]